jgi:hypothetical protein
MVREKKGLIGGAVAETGIVRSSRGLAWFARRLSASDPWRRLEEPEAVNAKIG